MECARVQQAKDILATHRKDAGQIGDTQKPTEVLQEAPIGRVPPEILRMFFTFAKPSDLADCIPSFNNPPLTLIQVCSLWRSVAMAIPDLWTGLCISLDHVLMPSRVKPPTIDELATQWFSRAGPHARFSLQFEGYFIGDEYGDDFSGIILSRSERFRELKISLSIRDRNSLATFIRGHENASHAFSQLEDLTIDCNQPGIGVTFATAGRLQRMNANIPFFSSEKSKNFAPWEQLTCLKIGLVQRTI